MRSRARNTSAHWLNRVEVDSLKRKSELYAAAAHRWDLLESPAQRMALVREIVATRAAELTLAYRNVVAVVAGYRTRRDAAGAEELHCEPCVVFMTKRKWQSESDGEGCQRLPSQILTYGPDTTASTQRTDRNLYAVPTDVQVAARHLKARAQALAAINVSSSAPKFQLPGTLTCGVHLRGASMKESCFALSAMHVLSPLPQQTEADGGAEFSAFASAPNPRGRSTAWGGFIDAEFGTGFDAQLAEVSDQTWFNQAFHPLRLSTRRPFVAAPDIFDELAATRSFRIIVHDHQPNARVSPRGVIWAQFSKTLGPEWRVIYDVRWGGQVTPVGISHPELLVLSVHPDCEVPVSGDSGSAVVCEAEDGALTLVGMYIACGPAGAERDAYVLPAWQLFDASNWHHLPAGTVTLHPTFSLP